MSKSDAIDAYNALEAKIKELHETTDIAYQTIDKAKAAISSCRDFLIAMGFKVVSPVSFKHEDINSVVNLIDYFYDSFKSKYPKEITPARNDNRDKKIANNLIAALAESGELTKKQALKEAAVIIDTMLSRPKDFPLVMSIGFRILSQGDMVWATEKAIGFINTQRAYKPTAYFEMLNDESNATYDGEIGFDLDELEGKDRGE